MEQVTVLLYIQMVIGTNGGVLINNVLVTHYVGFRGLMVKPDFHRSLAVVL